MIAGGTQKSNPGAPARCIPIVLVLVVIAACGFLDEANHWTEDVQLDDGSVITIERHVRFATSNSWAGDVPAAHDRRATLRFTEALSDLPKWDVPLTPMVLYQDGSTKEWALSHGRIRARCGSLEASLSRLTGNIASPKGNGVECPCRKPPRAAGQIYSSKLD